MKNKIKLKDISFRTIFNQSIEEKKKKKGESYRGNQIKNTKIREKSSSTKIINISCAEIQTDEMM